MLIDEILEDYNDFIQREGKVPNELHIPTSKSDEYEKLVSPFLKPDPFGKIKHYWFMGMRVFNEMFSFGCGWSKETDEIKSTG